MSSHHFVREGQEPALLMLEPVPFELAGPLLEWAPRFVVTQYALETVLSWNIKIDALIATQVFTEKHSATLADYRPLTIIPVAGSKEWLNAGLNFLVRDGQEVVHILCHDPESWITFERCPIGIAFVSTFRRWCLVSNGQYRKWLPAAAGIKVRKQPGQTMRTVGLQGQGEELTVIENGVVELDSDLPFWVAEPVFG